MKLVYQSSILATTTLHIDTQAPQLLLHATNGASQFAGDNQLLTTISPNGDGFRDRANVTFRLREPATVTMDVTRTVKVPNTIYTLTSTLATGVHTLTWAPAPTTNPRTFLVRVTAVDRAGNRVVYGAANAFVGRAPKGVVVRVQGIDAGFGQPSYAPGQVARIHIATDAPSLSMRIFRSGPEQVVTYADNQMAGVDIGTPPTPIDWSLHRSEPGSISFRIPNVPSGLYYAQFDAADGRVGYAPFVVRPAALGATGRVLVDPADEHVAGLQLPGRRRQRLRRHVVRRAAEPPRRPRAHLHRARRPAALLPLRPAVPALAVLVRQERGVHLRFRLRHDRERRRPRSRLRPGRLRGTRGVRDDARVRRRHALPRPRRQPDVPVGQQLLLEGRQAGPGAAQDHAVASESADPRPR